MKFIIRPMTHEDLPQVAEIDREAFPTMWPPPSFKRELANKLAFYVVACAGVDQATAQVAARGAEVDRGSGEKHGVTGWLKGLFSARVELPLAPPQHVIGFAGLWRMFDEVHLTTIAVRGAYRRQGIGEALLIATIDYAEEHGARTVTLEVRASNYEAQALYGKYGFKRAGLRRGYYTDNREDAVIMTTDVITSASYQAQLQKLRRLHIERLAARQNERQATPHTEIEPAPGE